MSDQPFKHLVALLDKWSTEPQNSTALPYPRMDPVNAPPAALALQLGHVWKQNAQTFLVSTTKNDPDAIPLGHVNTIAEVVDIPKFAAMLQVEQTSQETLPFNTYRSLEYQGFNVDELNPSDDATYGATGRKLQSNTATKAQAAAIFLLSRKSLHRINAAGWSNLALAFNLSNFTDLSPTLPAPHALQLLLILLANKTLHDKLDLLPQLAALGSGPLATSADLAKLTSAMYAAGILDNILKLEPPFQPNKDLIQQTLRTAQRGTQVAQLPHHIRPAVVKILQGFQDELQAGHYVRPDRVLLRLAPFFPPPTPTPTPPGPDSAELPIAMLAREPIAPGLLLALNGSASDPAVQFPPTDAAFMARPNQRPDPRRPAPTWDRQGRSTWDRQDRPDRSTPDSSASASGAPRRLLDDDADRKELLSLQKALQTLVAKLSTPKNHQSSSAGPSAHMAATDPVQPSIPQVATYHAQLQSDSDSDVELFH
jgi:hypothetical protein